MCPDVAHGVLMSVDVNEGRRFLQQSKAFSNSRSMLLQQISNYCNEREIQPEATRGDGYIIIAGVGRCVCFRAGRDLRSDPELFLSTAVSHNIISKQIYINSC